MRVTIYSRPGCHLCDDAKAVIERVQRDVPFALEQVDIDGDAALTEKYGLEIPVILVDGRKHAKYRVDEGAFRKALAAAEVAR